MSVPIVVELLLRLMVRCGFLRLRTGIPIDRGQ
jgi:hypothetical protein